jgi:hypothetical protein
MPDPTDTAASTQASETRPGEHVRLEFVLRDEADVAALLETLDAPAGAIPENAPPASASPGSVDTEADIPRMTAPSPTPESTTALDRLGDGRADAFFARVTRGLITYTLYVFVMSGDGCPTLVWLAVDAGRGPTGVYAEGELDAPDGKISTLARCAAERFTTHLHANVEFEERLETDRDRPTAWDRLKGDLDAED